jgi:hypothetical protein
MGNACVMTGPRDTKPQFRESRDWSRSTFDDLPEREIPARTMDTARTGRHGVRQTGRVDNRSGDHPSAR